MITLTNPILIKNQIGGDGTVAYNKLVLLPLRMYPGQGKVDATVELTSTANPSMPPIRGSLTIDGPLVRVEVERVNLYLGVQMSAGQQASLATIIANAQNALEAGLVNLGVVAGAQSAGA